jgi:hypothetical protein
VGYYTAGSGNFLPTFRGNLSVPSSGFKNPVQESQYFWILEPWGWDQILVDSWTLSIGPIGCFETLVRNYHYSLRNNPIECSSQLLRGGSLQSCIEVRSCYSVWHILESSVRYAGANNKLNLILPTSIGRVAAFIGTLACTNRKTTHREAHLTTRW